MAPCWNSAGLAINRSSVWLPAGHHHALNSGKLFTRTCLSLGSRIWCWPNGGDAPWLVRSVWVWWNVINNRLQAGLWLISPLGRLPRYGDLSATLDLNAWDYSIMLRSSDLAVTGNHLNFLYSNGKHKQNGKISSSARNLIEQTTNCLQLNWQKNYVFDNCSRMGKQLSQWWANFPCTWPHIVLECVLSTRNPICITFCHVKGPQFSAEKFRKFHMAFP